MPIINENDTVSVAEIRFGDNDHLAAMVTNLLQAPLLVHADDRRWVVLRRSADRSEWQFAFGPCRTSTAGVSDMAGASKSTLGTGGMRSKLRAARLATAAGESVIMANGSRARHSRPDLAAGEPVGTLFLPARRNHAGLQALARLHRPSQGPPAARCRARSTPCESPGKSLLPVGVVAVGGSFGKGEVVAICDATGAEFARGLTNYSSSDADQICGLSTDRIADVLGTVPYVELVHRDNLALLE